MGTDIRSGTSPNVKNKPEIFLRKILIAECSTRHTLRSSLVTLGRAPGTNMVNNINRLKKYRLVYCY
jgi:hypothetical protein